MMLCDFFSEGAGALAGPSEELDDDSLLGLAETKLLLFYMKNCQQKF